MPPIWTDPVSRGWNGSDTWYESWEDRMKPGCACHHALMEPKQPRIAYVLAGIAVLIVILRFGFHVHFGGLWGHCQDSRNSWAC
jgi:hypothetical protein